MLPRIEKMENENENHARSLHHPAPPEVALDQHFIMKMQFPDIRHDPLSDPRTGQGPSRIPDAKYQVKTNTKLSFL